MEIMSRRETPVVEGINTQSFYLEKKKVSEEYRFSVRHSIAYQAILLAQRVGSFYRISSHTNLMAVR